MCALGFTRSQKGYKCFFLLLTAILFQQMSPSMSLHFTIKVLLIPLSLHLIPSIFLILSIFLWSVIFQVCLVCRQFLFHHLFKFIVTAIVLNNQRVTHLKCQLLCLLQVRQLNLPFHQVTIRKKSVRGALAHPGWHQTMLDDLSALHNSGTWELVPLPYGKFVVGYR